MATIVRDVLTKLRLRRRIDLPWLVHGALERVWSDANDAFATWQLTLNEDALARLSVGEREVAILLVRGLSNAAIAAERGTAVRTVANQVRSIASKLGVSGRIEIAVVLLEGSERE